MSEQQADSPIISKVGLKKNLEFPKEGKEGEEETGEKEEEQKAQEPQEDKEEAKDDEKKDASENVEEDQEGGPIKVGVVVPNASITN